MRASQAEKPGVRAPADLRQRGPIFVVGNSRSGTTMMGRVLGRHPEVFTLGEIHFFEQLWSAPDGERSISRTEAVSLAARLLCIQRDGYLNQGRPERFYEEAERLLASLRPGDLVPAKIFEAFLVSEAEKNGKTVPCDQTPRNVFYIGEILALYPEARVINMVRDPRDVLLSQKRKWKRRFLGAYDIPLREALRSWANYHPIIISKLWNASTSAAGRHAGDPRVHFLRFEDLVNEPESNIREVCEFAGLSFEENMLQVPRVGSSSGLDHPEQRGIDRDRAGSWKSGGLSSTEIFLCQKITGGPMRRYGYPLLTLSRPNAPRLVASLVSFPAKLVFALLLNLGRMRNIQETIRRRLS
ncbi:MAG TPA: sulfotransferase [Rubrobacter sp.]|nr:sulfotransferase [Rubrobacter sp.]